MSRFILLPTETKNSFTLVSTEDCLKPKIVELPDELVDMSIFEFLEVEFQKLQMVLLKIKTRNIIYNAMKL